VKGHFKKRGSSWYYWAELGVGPDGRRQQKSAGGFKTRREAEEAFARLRDSVRTGGYVSTSKLTLGAFLVDEWLPAIRASVRPTTLQHYSSYVTVHVVPKIGRLQLSRVGPAQLNAFYAGLLADGRADGGGGLSPKSVRHIHGCLHKALQDAVRWGHLARNPADAADPPVPRTVEMKVWSPAELRAFLAAVGGDRLYAAWLLLATTGMRRGEVLGLRWADVDLERRRLSVVRQPTTVNYQVTVSEPKTAKGRRSVALDALTAKALRAHRAQQSKERLANASIWRESGLVFTLEDGSPLHPHRFTAWFEQRRLATGLPRIRLHDIRHSYATAALSAGVAAKVVSERLGHANVSITLDTYSHVLPALQEDAADKVAALILGS
jgi:integrase